MGPAALAHFFFLVVLENGRSILVLLEEPLSSAGGTAAPAAPDRYHTATRSQLTGVALPTVTKGAAGPAASRCVSPLAADAIPVAPMAPATRT